MPLPPKFVALSLAFGLEPDLLNELICGDLVAENPRRLILRDIDPEIADALRQRPNVHVARNEIIVTRQRDPFVLPFPG